MRIKRKQDIGSKRNIKFANLGKAGRYLDLTSFNWETSR